MKSSVIAHCFSFVIAICYSYHLLHIRGGDKYDAKGSGVGVILGFTQSGNSMR